MDLENFDPNENEKLSLKILKYEFDPFWEQIKKSNPNADRNIVFETWVVQQIANQRIAISKLIERITELENTI